MCRGACGAFVRTSEHVSHYKLKSFTGDFVYLISIKPPPLPTWKSDRDFKKKKRKKIPLLPLIPNNDPRIVVKTHKKKKKRGKNGFIKSVPTLMAVKTCHFYPHSTKMRTTQNTRHTWAQLLSSGIPQKVKSAIRKIFL